MNRFEVGPWESNIINLRNLNQYPALQRATGFKIPSSLLMPDFLCGSCHSFEIDQGPLLPYTPLSSNEQTTGGERFVSSVLNSFLLCRPY